MQENSKLREPKKDASLPAKKEASKASSEALLLGLIIGLGIFASSSLWWAAFVPPIVLPVLVYRAKYRALSAGAGDNPTSTPALIRGATRPL